MKSVSWSKGFEIHFGFGVSPFNILVALIAIFELVFAARIQFPMLQIPGLGMLWPLYFELPRELVISAMLIGCVPWVYLTVVAWEEIFQRSSKALTIFEVSALTAVAGISVTGIFIDAADTLFKTAMWINAVSWALSAFCPGEFKESL